MQESNQRKNNQKAGFIYTFGNVGKTVYFKYSY